MGHRYHPDVALEVGRRLDEMVAAGRVGMPVEDSLQTRTLRYNESKRLTVHALAHHYDDSRLDASFTSTLSTVTASENVLAFAVQSTARECAINGAIIAVPPEVAASGSACFARSSTNSAFECVPAPPTCGTTVAEMRKVPGLQGPMDDAFMSPFLVVTPESEGTGAVDEFIRFELNHLLERWAGLFRGDPRVKKASELTAEDKESFNLILFGTPASNSAVAEFFQTPALPFAWDGAGQLSVAGEDYGGSTAPQLVFPSPFGSGKYVLLNSGTTFREGHDTTNSMQNAKLPDYVVVDYATAPPDELSPGAIVAAGFCDESWVPQAPMM